MHVTGSSAPTTYGRVAIFVLLFTAGLNIPYWVACHTLSLLPIGWFSIESLATGLVVLFLSRWLGAVLLIFFFAENILLAVSRTYYLTPYDCLDHLPSLASFAPARIVAMVAGVVLALVYFVLLCLLPVRLLRSRGQRVTAAAGIVLFFLLGLAVDSFAIRSTMGRFANLQVSSRAGDQNRFTHYSSLWFFRYATLRLITSQHLFAYTPASQKTQHLTDYPDINSASKTTLSSLGPISHDSRFRPDIVLIVVESWGEFEDPKMRALFEDIYRTTSLEQKYDIRTGATHFHGSTVGGEGRELCNADIGFDMERATADELKTCLPEKLDAAGYETTAVHGMDGHLFMRQSWYRNLGFDDLWFHDRFLKLGLPDCVGAFRGTCDTAIASWVTSRLRADGTRPQFLYWMTLNSHLPLPVPSGLQDPASCAPLQEVTAPFCSWYQFVVKVHQSVAAMADAVVRPTVFVVVGDHAPPFSNIAVRNQFSQSDVPYEILLPKAGAFTH